MERDGMVLRMQEDCERIVGVGCEDPQDSRFVSFNTFILVTISHKINRPRSRRTRPKANGYCSLAIVLVHFYTSPGHERVIGNLARSLRIRISTSPCDQDGSAWCALNSRRVPHIASNSHVDGLLGRYDLGTPCLRNSARRRRPRRW